MVEFRKLEQLPLATVNSVLTDVRRLATTKTEVGSGFRFIAKHENRRERNKSPSSSLLCGSVSSGVSSGSRKNLSCRRINNT